MGPAGVNAPAIGSSGRICVTLVTPSQLPPGAGGWSYWIARRWRLLRAVRKGLGILRDQDEWKANLAPDAPSFVADQFHPHVWAAVSGLWETGRCRVA
jgi:hypothetical protein